MAPMPGCLSKIYSALWLQQFGAAGKDLHGVRFSNRFMRQLFFRRFISDQPGLLAGLRGFDRQGGDCLIDIVQFLAHIFRQIVYGFGVVLVGTLEQSQFRADFGQLGRQCRRCSDVVAHGDKGPHDSDIHLNSGVTS